MRATSIAIISAAALLSAQAFAQTTPPATTAVPPRPATAPAPAGTVPAATVRTQAVNPLTMEDVSKITGTNVYGSDDKKIGDISTVLMKPDTRRIDRLVVAAGGVLGVGSHHVALPVDQFTWDASKDGFKIAKTTDDLKAMPEWKSPSTASTGSAVPARTPKTSG